MAGQGHFHWNELMTWDLEKAKAFYGATLGWTFSDMPMPGGFTYTLAKAGETVVGGMMQMTEEMGFAGLPEHWFAYIEVDDVDDCLSKAAAAGGHIARPAFDVEGVGRIGILHDANKAGIGLITPTSQDE